MILYIWDYIILSRYISTFTVTTYFFVTIWFKIFQLKICLFATMSWISKCTLRINIICEYLLSPNLLDIWIINITEEIFIFTEHVNRHYVINVLCGDSRRIFTQVSINAVHVTPYSLCLRSRLEPFTHNVSAIMIHF